MTIRNRIKELRMVPAKDLRPSPWNWRLHGPAQQAALRGILAEVGYAGALLARVLPDGGLETIDGHLRAETTPDQEVPVLVLDVTEDEAKKLLLTFDPLGAMAEANNVALLKLAEEVDTAMPGLEALYADLREQGNLGLILSGELQEGQNDPDDIPLPPDEPVTQPGDLWILGDPETGHRLLCADSSKPADVDRLLGGAPVHLVNTDPPYNVRVEPRSNNAIAAGLSSFAPTPASDRHHQALDLALHPEKSQPTTRQMRAKDRPLQNDFMSDEAFDGMLQAWFGNIARVLLPGRCFYIWGGYANCGNYPPVLKRCGLYFAQAIIWVKEHPVLTRKDFMGNHEWSFYGWREGAGHKFYGPNNATDVWSVKKVNPQSMVHLTEKPVELAARALQYSSLPGENVLDLFGGSGSSLIAAEQTGRRAFLMELDAPYCDVIVQRWEKFTGKKAERQAAAAPTAVTAPATER